MKIIICTFDSFGFLYPMIGLASSLKRLGYDVTFVSSKSVSQTIIEHGFSWVGNFKTNKDSFLVRKIGDMDDISNQIDHIECALSNSCFDFMITSPLSFGSILAAERFHLKVVTLGFFSYLWSFDKVHPDLPRHITNICKWRTAEMLKVYSESRKFNGFREKYFSHGHIPLVGDVMLQRSIPSLMIERRDFPKNVIPFGSCLWEPKEIFDEEEKLHDWLGLPEHSGRKIVYVNHGRTFYMKKFWSLIQDTFSETDYLIIADINRMDGFAGNVPKNFFVSHHLPMRAVTSRASLFISGGHTTPVLAALENAIPMILFPTGGETLDNAFYCNRVGAALCFEEESYCEKTIFDAVGSMMSAPSVKDICIALSQEFGLYKEESYRASFINAELPMFFKNLQAC